MQITKYNKTLQNNLDISIINYKIFKCKYIIYEYAKIGKEYYDYNDNLIFKGEYQNWERNRRDKEYNNEDLLIYERE